MWIGFNNRTSHTLFLHLLVKSSLFLLFFLLWFIGFLECALSSLYLEMMVILSNLVTFLTLLDIKYLNTIFTIYLCRLLVQTGELSLLLGVMRSQKVFGEGAMHQQCTWACVFFYIHWASWLRSCLKKAMSSLSRLPFPDNLGGWVHPSLHCREHWLFMTRCCPPGPKNCPQHGAAWRLYLSQPPPVNNQLVGYKRLTPCLMPDWLWCR